jgi:hypothetical protein
VPSVVKPLPSALGSGSTVHVRTVAVCVSVRPLFGPAVTFVDRPSSASAAHTSTSRSGFASRSTFSTSSPLSACTVRRTGTLRRWEDSFTWASACSSLARKECVPSTTMWGAKSFPWWCTAL